MPGAAGGWVSQEAVGLAVGILLSSQQTSAFLVSQEAAGFWLSQEAAVFLSSEEAAKQAEAKIKVSSVRVKIVLDVVFILFLSKNYAVCPFREPQ